MRLAQDKIAHLKAGLAVLLAAAAGTLLMLHVGVQPLAVVLLIVGLGTGAAVEFAQRDSNARLAAAGQPALHDVSAADLLASAAPCILGAGVIELLARLGVLVLP